MKSFHENDPCVQEMGVGSWELGVGRRNMMALRISFYPISLLPYQCLCSAWKSAIASARADSRPSPSASAPLKVASSIWPLDLSRIACRLQYVSTRTSLMPGVFTPLSMQVGAAARVLAAGCGLAAGAACGGA